MGDAPAMEQPRKMVGKRLVVESFDICDSQIGKLPVSIGRRGRQRRAVAAQPEQEAGLLPVERSRNEGVGHPGGRVDAYVDRVDDSDIVAVVVGGESSPVQLEAVAD